MGLALGTPCCNASVWRFTLGYVNYQNTYHEYTPDGTADGFDFSFLIDTIGGGTGTLVNVTLIRLSGNNWRVEFEGKSADFTHDFSTGRSPDILLGVPQTCYPTQPVITIQYDSDERADDFTYIPNRGPSTLTAYRKVTKTRSLGDPFLTTYTGPLTLTQSEDASYDYWTGQYSQPVDATPVYLGIRCGKNGQDFQFKLAAANSYASLAGPFGFRVASIKPFAALVGYDTFGDRNNIARIFDPADPYPMDLYEFPSFAVEGVDLETQTLFDDGDSLGTKSLGWSCLATESIFDTTAIRAAIASHFGYSGVAMGNQSVGVSIVDDDTEIVLRYAANFTSSTLSGWVFGEHRIQAIEGLFTQSVTLHGSFELDDPIGESIEFSGEFLNASTPRECSPVIKSLPRLNYPTDYVNIDAPEENDTDWTIYIDDVEGFLIEPTFAGQGNPPYTFAHVSGTLPGGATYNVSNGTFGGGPLTTPATGSAIFEITDSSGKNSITQTYTWKIIPPPSSII